MKRSVQALLIAEAVVALGLLLIGSAADWMASNYTVALLVVCGLSVFATLAMVGRGGNVSSGGALTDPIGRGSVRGTPAGALMGTFEMAVDDDASAELDLFPGAAPAPRPFPLVPAGLAVATGIGALVSKLVFE